MQKSKSENVNKNQAWIKDPAKQSTLGNDKLKKQAKQVETRNDSKPSLTKRKQDVSVCGGGVRVICSMC